MSKIYSLICVAVLCTIHVFSQQATKYIIRDGSEITLSPQELAKKLPSDIKPLFNYAIRDASICIGPDSTYYLTGTTGDPDMWAVTSDIKIWKSKDLRSWLPVVTVPRTRTTVWNADRDGGEWTNPIMLRDGAPFRPLWAPEIHYFNNNFWLTYSFPFLGNSILKSTTGKAEGPYISAIIPDKPLNTDIDASLFCDDDGKVYSVMNNGKICRMKDDMTGPAEEYRPIVPSNHRRVGFEGGSMFKANGKYYFIAAEFINGEYHCMAAMADSIYGPYGPRYLAIPNAGHNVVFRDLKGNWWSTFFGNDKKAPFRERPAIVRILFDKEGRIYPASKNFPN